MSHDPNDLQKPSRFDYIKYDEVRIDAQLEFKASFQNIERAVETLPNGRAKSLVLTKLEEAYMWVGKALRDEQLSVKPSTPLQEERNDS